MTRLTSTVALALGAAILALALTAGATQAEECSVPGQHKGNNVRTDGINGIGRYIVNPNPATGCWISCHYNMRRDEGVCPVTTKRANSDENIRGYLQFSAPHFNCKCDLPGGAERFIYGAAVYYRCGAQNDMWRAQGYRITMNLHPGQIDLDTNHTTYECFYDWER